MFDIKSVRVSRNKNDEDGIVLVKNPNNYKLIGIGFHGAVFKLSDDKCVKIYANHSDARAEAQVYRAMENSTIIPKLYRTGEKYIIMEYVKGIILRDYLYKAGYLPVNITKKLINLFKSIKYKEHVLTDIELNNIIVDEHENFKLIDLCEILWMEARPVSLFKELDIMHMLNSFLLQVKQFDYEMFKTWELSMTEYKNVFIKIREKDILINNKVNYSKKAVVLTYHSVSDMIYKNDDLNSVTISTEKFRTHLRGLKDYGFNIISLRHLLDAVQNKAEMPPNAAVITFDDGKSNFYSDAFPILSSYKMPVTCFIITKLTEYNKNQISDDTILSPAQLKKLYQSGLVDIQSHTHSNHDLIFIDKDKNIGSSLCHRIYNSENHTYEGWPEYRYRVTQDLFKSRNIINEYTGIMPDVLCLPFGEYNNDVIRLAEKCGFKYFITTDRGNNSEGSKSKFINRIEETSLGFEDLLYRILDIVSMQASV